MNKPSRPVAGEGPPRGPRHVSQPGQEQPSSPPEGRSGSRKTRWLRLLAVAGSAGALFLVCRRLDLAGLARALARVHPGLYLAALGLFGLGLIPSGFRWHQMLRLNHCEVSGATSVRMVFLSHFFSTVLFGPSSGDVPKTVLYCRWFGFRGTDVLAASMLDRLVAGAGGLLFFTAAFIAAAFSGGLDFFSRLRLETPPPSWPLWLAGATLALGLASLWWRSRRADSFARRTVGSLGLSLRRLASCRVATARAFGCALLVVATLTLAQVLCVRAASQTPISLWNLAWGLHIATMIASLPITVAGIGLREGAYISLLALYGATAPEAVAAALLTLSLHAFWAVIGFTLWLREQQLRTTANRGASATAAVRIRVLPPQTAPPAQPEPAETGTADTSPTAPPATNVWIFQGQDGPLEASALAAIRRCCRDATILGGVMWRTDARHPLQDAMRRLKAWFRLWLSGDLACGTTAFAREEALRAEGWRSGQPMDPERLTQMGRRLRARGRLGLAVASGGHGLRLEPGNVGLDARDVGVRS